MGEDHTRDPLNVDLAALARKVLMMDAAALVKFADEAPELLKLLAAKVLGHIQ